MIDICPVILSCEPSTCLLLDSLGSWVANLIEQDDQNWQEQVSRFLQTLQDCQINLILVAEETGWGVVPAYPIGRLFRDRLGELVQKVAPLCDSVYLVTAGHVLNLSELGQILIT
jgi:adenosylcobinamide kinase/adenosylcobinamide-phosphate guanylyltransferase